MAALGRLPAVLGMRRMQKLKIRIFQAGKILEGKPEGYARQGAHFRFLFVSADAGERGHLRNLPDHILFFRRRKVTDRRDCNFLSVLLFVIILTKRKRRR